MWSRKPTSRARATAAPSATTSTPPKAAAYLQSGPRFVQPLAGDLGEIEEGAPLHLECRCEPTQDSTLRVYWLHNNRPISHAHRFKHFYDFGWAVLDVLHTYAEDSGAFTCVAESALGKADTSASFTCQRKLQWFKMCLQAFFFNTQNSNFQQKAKF